MNSGAFNSASFDATAPGDFGRDLPTIFRPRVRLPAGHPDPDRTGVRATGPASGRATIRLSAGQPDPIMAHIRGL